MGVKLKDIWKGVKIGTAIGSVVAPGGVGKILNAVTKSIDDKDDPANVEAIKALKTVNEAQEAKLLELEQACLALHERVKKLEGR